MIEQLIPRTPDGIKVYYFLVMVGYILVHLLWDAASKNTPPLSADRLRAKAGLAYDASTLASSSLILIAIFDQALLEVLGDFWLPLMLAGIGGILASFPSLFPKP